MDGSDPTERSRHQWSAVSAAWESNRRRLFEFVRPVSERLVEQVGARPGATLLELTAGPGETGFLAAARLGPDGLLISSDFVPAMVDAARRGAEALGLDNVEYRVLDAQAIDLPDDRVDGVLSRFGMMLLPEPARAVSEVRRVLRPGGAFAYATWGPPDRNPWLFRVAAALVEHGHELPGDPFAPGGVFSLATAEANRDLLEAGGFTDVATDEVTGTETYDDLDDYWTFNTSVAGPIAALVDTLDAGELLAVRASLEASLAGFRHGNVLELPWAAEVVTAREVTRRGTG